MYLIISNCRSDLQVQRSLSHSIPVRLHSWWSQIIELLMIILCMQSKVKPILYKITDSEEAFLPVDLTNREVIIIIIIILANSV